MEVAYKDHMGSDLSVVNAARISFGKEVRKLGNKDQRLIEYLAEHGHWTPFAHTAVTLHIKAPFFVARQLGKHQVGLAWNEISRRYVNDTPECYTPMVWRMASKDKKQGSSEKTIKHDVKPFQDVALRNYKTMIQLGIAPEMARMVLPMSTYTEWYWTGSVYAFSRVCKLRLQPDAQKETQELVKMICATIEPLFPESWGQLLKGVVCEPYARIIHPVNSLFRDGPEPDEDNYDEKKEYFHKYTVQDWED